MSAGGFGSPVAVARCGVASHDIFGTRVCAPADFSGRAAVSFLAYVSIRGYRRVAAFGIVHAYCLGRIHARQRLFRQTLGVVEATSDALEGAAIVEGAAVRMQRCRRSDSRIDDDVVVVEKADSG